MGLFLIMGIIALCIMVYVLYDMVREFIENELGPYEDETDDI